MRKHIAIGEKQQWAANIIWLVEFYCKLRENTGQHRDETPGPCSYRLRKLCATFD